MRLTDFPAHAGCAGEASGEIPKAQIPLTRRRFLQGAGVLTGTLVAGTPVALLAPSLSWAVELKTLGTAEGEALAAMARTLYPHKKLPDAVYALVAKDLDTAAAGDAATALQLKEGVLALNKAAGGNFAAASPEARHQVVKNMEGQPFFNTVRGKCVTSLYDNDMAFAALGYPGASWDKGGYINRGFQDLKWLPDPPASASPPKG